MRIQPDEGISLRFATKVPGQGIAMRDVAMDFRYGAAFGSSTPEAYERLILDAMRGDADALHARRRGRGAVGLHRSHPRAAGAECDAPVATYEAGSWGPPEADALLAPGDAWRRP